MFRKLLGAKKKAEVSQVSEDRWRQYLFEDHAEAELRGWAKRLKYFRFFRAYGGHANDGDSLDVTFAYETTTQLDSFLHDLGVNVVKFEVRPPQPEPGVSYREDVFYQFPSLIDGTAWVKQPGHCQIMGVNVFVWCEDGIAKISLGEGYIVSEKNIIDAEKLEKMLAGISLEIIDPPRDTNHYFCPKYYPGYFDN